MLIPVFGLNGYKVFLKEKTMKRILKSLKTCLSVTITAEDGYAIFRYTTKTGKGEIKMNCESGMIKN